MTILASASTNISDNCAEVFTMSIQTPLTQAVKMSVHVENALSYHSGNPKSLPSGLNLSGLFSYCYDNELPFSESENAVKSIFVRHYCFHRILLDFVDTKLNKNVHKGKNFIIPLDYRHQN